MVAELISVGTEILLGEILNTDAKFLAEELSKIGIDVYHQVVVGDNANRLKEALKLAASRSDVIIASGGLGPTPDDITKEVIAEFMDEELVLHEESLKRMEDYFKRMNRVMVKSNIKQAMMPENSIVLPNNCGTAPGCIIEKNGIAVIMLPGPPSELTAMYRESVKPYLEKKTGAKLYTKTFHIFGIGESSVAEKFSEMMEKGTNPSLAPYAKTGEVHLRLAVKSESEDEANEILEKTSEELRSELGEYIYSEDGKNLNETVVELLIKNKQTISCAESCTGGLLAKMITDIPGTSEIFNESYITYANASKERILGVSHETIEENGVVSEKVAMEMAEGVRKVSGSDIGVGITGIAGPTGGTETKPVGLVYVAVSTKDGVFAKELHLNGNRDRVRYLTCLNAFDMIRKIF